MYISNIEKQLTPQTQRPPLLAPSSYVTPFLQNLESAQGVEAKSSEISNLSVEPGSGTGISEKIRPSEMLPSDLVRVLTLAKASPASTIEEFNALNAVWHEYSLRYAFSNWNYDNMDGLPKDDSLQPKKPFDAVTNYAEPVNQAINSAFKRESETYGRLPASSERQMMELMEKHPVINQTIQSLTEVPGADLSLLAPSLLPAVIGNYAADIEQLGGDAATRHFLNLFKPADFGKPEQGMNDPVFASITRIQQSVGTAVSDSDWTKQAERSIGPAGLFQRDPSGRGVGFRVSNDKFKQPEIVFLDKSGNGRVKGGDVGNDDAKLLEQLDLLAISPSTVKILGDAVDSSKVAQEMNPIYEIDLRKVYEYIDDYATDSHRSNRLEANALQNRLSNVNPASVGSERQAWEIERTHSAANRLKTELSLRGASLQNNFRTDWDLQTLSLTTEGVAFKSTLSLLGEQSQKF